MLPSLSKETKTPGTPVKNQENKYLTNNKEKKYLTNNYHLRSLEKSNFSKKN
jgi:hypothetical protein